MEVFSFSNYRQFVQSILKKKGQKGKMNRLAEAIPIHATQLSKILSGVKDFNLEQAYSVCEYFGLTSIETRYFLLLVEKERAGTHKLKKFFSAEIEKVQKESRQISSRLKEHRSLSDEKKSIFYSSWMYSAISLYCSIGKGATLEDISNFFQIDRKKALEMTDFLVVCGLCDRDQELYTMGIQHTHVAAKSPHAIRHHLNWRLRGLEKQERVQDEELVFTAPMAISSKDFLVIREKITAAIKDFIEVAKESEADHLAYLTIDWLKV